MYGKYTQNAHAENKRKRDENNPFAYSALLALANEEALLAPRSTCLTFLSAIEC